MPSAPPDPRPSRALIRRLRKLRTDAGFREAEGVFVAEGIHLAQAALAAGASLELAGASARLDATPEGTELRGALARAGIPVVEFEAGVLDSLQDARAPQPVLVVARRNARSVDTLFDGAATPLLAIAWGIQDPGNLGTILRTAAAAGATGAVVVGDGADLFHPRTVRATAGAIFGLPTSIGDRADLLAAVSRRGVALVAADAAGDVLYEAHDFRGPVAILLGREGSGLSAEALAAAAARVRIPMRAGVESLSVGAAAAVLLFEAARQRRVGS